MNFRNIYTGLGRAAVMMAALMAASCAETTEGLLDTVPATTPMVAQLNLDTVLRRAGCSTGNGEVRFTPQVADLLGIDSDTDGTTPPVRVLSALNGTVDMTDVVAYCYDDASSRHLVTVRITDRQKFDDRVATLGAVVTNAAGVEYYEIDGWTLAAMDDQAWLAPGTPGVLAGAILESADRKRSESVASLNGIADFLNGDEAVNIAVRNNAAASARKDQSDPWTCVSVKIEEQVVGLHLTRMEGDGNPLPVASGLKQVDTDFLRYVPGNYVLAAAIGCSPEFDWMSLRPVVSMIMGPEAAMNVQVLEPFLSKLDGTVAFAAGPAGGAPAIADVNYRTWDFLIMAHLPQVEVDRAMGMMAMYGAQMGVKMSRPSDNIAELTLPDGAVLYVGNVDGYLAVSNREFDPTGQNSMTDIFVSRQGAAVLNVPAGSEIVKAFGMPCGFDFNVQLTDNDLHARLSLNGSDRSVLQVLLEELVK